VSRVAPRKLPLSSVIDPVSGRESYILAVFQNYQFQKSYSQKTKTWEKTVTSTQNEFLIKLILLIYHNSQNND